MGRCVLCLPTCTFAWKASHANLSDNREQNPSQRWLSCSAAWAMSSARLPSGRADKTRGGVTQSKAHWYILQSSPMYDSSPCRGQINTHFMQTESATVTEREVSQEVNSKVSLSNLMQLANLMCKTPVLESKNLHEVPGSKRKKKINLQRRI